MAGKDIAHEDARRTSWRNLAKAAVVALSLVGFATAGFSGALAHGGDDGWDDDSVFASGASGGSGGSGGSGWDDDDWPFGPSGGFMIPSGGSGGSGGEDWDDGDDD